jgi:hypothetical protein
MAGQSLAYVLGVLRRFKSTAGMSVGNTTLDYIQKWVGGSNAAAVAKVQISVLENTKIASSVVTNSRLSEEAKIGLLHTLAQMETMFSAGQITGSVQAYFPALDSAITNFAIVTSHIQASVSAESIEAAKNLASEIDDLISQIDSLSSDQVQREICRRHLNALSGLLKNIDAFGVDTALSAYYDMILSLRKDLRTQTEDSSNGDGIWAKIKSIGGKLKDLNDLVETGAKILPYVDDLPKMIGF